MVLVTKQQFIGGIAVSLGAKVLDKALDRALDNALPAKTPTKETVKREVVENLGPYIENMTNQEPLWRSKVLWTALGSLAIAVGDLATMFTDNVPNTPAQYVVSITAVVTAIGTIIARIAPSKAIGR
jgi:hypothetical protein